MAVLKFDFISLHINQLYVSTGSQIVLVKFIMLNFIGAHIMLSLKLVSFKFGDFHQI